jgi:nitroreductase/NAD-dependent dihydropyrimidine dehydrogenase PreA subunit
MDIFAINEQTCTKCGACAEVCHLPIIDFQPNEYPKPFPEAEQFCSKCAACLIVCPTGSLTHRDIPMEQCLPIDETLRVTHDQCAQLLKARRSVRWFEDRPVPRDLIAKAIDAARYAPTGNNMQNVQWLVIDDKNKLHRFAGVGNDWLAERIRNSPMSALAAAGEKKMKAGMDLFLRDAPAVVSVHAHKDYPINATVCQIALAYFDLAAISLGLGCYWDGFFNAAANSVEPIKNEIQLPEGHQLFGSLAIGYPKYRFPRIPMRKPASISWQ